MAITSLKDQLTRDLTASWQKPIILGVLLLVGLVLWLRPIVSVWTSEEPAASSSPATEATANRPPIEAEATFGHARNGSRTGSLNRITWQHVDEVLDRDPLVRSAEVAAFHSDPFRMDDDQFPPPILFAEEQAAAAEPYDEELDEPANPAGLILKSTIVGVSRRAAYINTRLYFEGTDVPAEDGRTYRLTAVYPRRVVLQTDEETFELKIANNRPSSGID